MSDSALTQLLEMGIPLARAKAALARGKGDAMAAAERVFAGEFDDIPSDDDDDDDDDDEPIPIDDDDGDQVMGESSGGEGSSASGLSEDEGGYGGFEEDDDLEEDRLLSDPYAGIFFSKDRKVTVIETIEPPSMIRVHDPRRNAAKQGMVTAQRLTMGRWMSGCPEGNEQSFLFQLWNTLTDGTLPCAHECGYAFKRKPEDFFLLFPDFPTYIAYLEEKVQPICPTCSGKTCLACGEKADDRPRSPKDRVKKDSEEEEEENLEVDALLHCVNMQGVMIGVGLQMIEECFTQGKNGGTSSPNASPPKKRSRTTRSTHPAVVAEPTSPNQAEDEDEMDDYQDMLGGTSGTGYAGNVVEDRSGQIQAQENQKKADQATATLLGGVRIYLPQTDRSSKIRTSDHLVHPITLAHLRRRSGFVNDLLRNDSLLDMSNRGDLYRALFHWLEIIANHEALASMLAMLQMRPSLISPVQGESHQREVVYEGSASPRELLENLVIQAKAALRGLQMSDKEEVLDPEDYEESQRMSKKEADQRMVEKQEEMKTDENSVLKAFCDRIVRSAETIDKRLVETKGKAFVDRMRESLPKLPGVGDEVQADTSGKSDDMIVKIYEEWATKARFQHADLSIKEGNTLKYRHAFSKQIESLDGQDAPKRSLAIAKELAILTTNLPVAWHSTIFLRVDEARLDCIKAMIIGPEGTPYENGCFIFDIHLPIDYNQRCPSVKTMTTNGGNYRYNPNLYADGKVCLSLLGTWSGPGWIAGQSTLLQVLISVQSLILCEEPYLNEPGWESQKGSARSKAYSANIRRMVLIDAMANNIKNPPYPFENEIKTHFRLKSRYLRDQIERWRKLDDGQGVDPSSFVAANMPPPGSATGPGQTTSQSGQFDKAARDLLGLLDDLDGTSDSKASDMKDGSGKVKGDEVESIGGPSTRSSGAAKVVGKVMGAVKKTTGGKSAKK